MNAALYCSVWLSLRFLGATHSVSAAGDADCGLSEEQIQQVRVRVSREIRKSGFHRELVLSLRCGAAFPDRLWPLLVQHLPAGIYVDPYHLESLRHDGGLQVLLDSEVDLEAPAYASHGFTAFVFPARDLRDTNSFLATVPIHGRYQRPSGSGRKWEQLLIEAPRLLLRSDPCRKLCPHPPDKLVEAPCTAHNTSTCSWLEIQHWQDQQAVSLELPVGDQSLMVPVCAGTLLVTLLCCGLIARAVWARGWD
ncbi:phosphatidylinositol-glycan biosynthesis class X protein precursor-like [Scleropages formosus]|uniref:Phosphatidylinositol-glycan biosynthesis class X protein n=1 Tax=Scleropages formosus TaxID=113540 RepID=A0A0P7U6W2_SCLFO|nr:phosphatidylinositol-glycan biosynthesis class X protein precursor-like [Scleropages formosus]